jgi:RHS repeat-associated protein
MITRARRSISRVTMKCILTIVGVVVALPQAVTAQAPPSTTFSSTSAYVATNTLRETLVICAPSGMGIDSIRMTLNGTSVTSHFAVGGTGSCPGGTSPVVDTGTVTPAFGVNTLSVYACAWDGVFTDPHTCGPTGYTFHHTYVEVTPKGTAVSGHVSEPSTQQFQVQNLLSTTQTFNLSVACSGSGVSGCSTAAKTPPVAANATDTVTVSFTAGALNATGTIMLVATDSAQTGAVDTGSVSYTANWLTPETISTAYTNQEDQDMSRCAINCFAARASVSTVPYVSRDVANGVTLVYNSDQMADRPVLYADVKMAASNPYTLQGFQIRAQYYDPTNGWLRITFLNGDSVLHFAAVTDTVWHRMAGEFSDSALATNHGQAVYRLLMQVITQYADHADTLMDSTHHLVVVNGRSSPIAKGWSIAGVSVDNWGVGSSPDQHYEMHLGGDGASVALVGPFSCGSVDCYWYPVTTGVFAYLFYKSQPYAEYKFPDSTREVFNPDGFLTARVGLPSDTVAYGYDAQNRVITISDPYRMQPLPNNTKHTYWEINYGTNGISSIVEPDSAGHPGLGRTTTITVNSSGLLTAWQDPDGVSSRFGYDSHNRLDSLTDRKGHVTTFAYDSLSWKLTTVTSPADTIDNTGNGTGSLQTLVETFKAWQTIGVPTTSTSGTPATAVTLSSVIASDSAIGGKVTFTADRWGQPLTFTDPLGHVTTFVYDGNGFDTTVTYPTGAVDRFNYDFGPYLVASTPAGQSETDYQYGAYGQLTQISGVGQPTQKFYVDANGHTDSASVNGSTWRYYGDAYGRDTMTADAAHDSTEYVYDSETGNLASMTAKQGGRSITRTFDGHGRGHTIAVSTPTGQAVITTTVYDSLNRVISSTDGLHPTPMRFTYDSLFPKSITDPLGQQYRSTYNAFGWPRAETDTANRKLSATYSSFGSPTTNTNRRGQPVQTLYDAYGRIASVTRPTSEPDSVDGFSYDTSSYIVTDSNRVVKDVTYSSRTTGLVDSIVTTFRSPGRSFKRAYTRDALGRVTAVAITTNPSGLVLNTRTMGYDPTSGLIDSLGLSNTHNPVYFGYDSLFRLNSVTYPSVVRNDTYFPTGQLASTNWTNLPIFRSYGYDSSGRISQVDYDGVLKGDSLALYTYDVLGELVQRQLAVWTDTLTSCPGIQLNGYGCQVGYSRSDSVLQTVKYSYDAAGSLDTVKVGSTDSVATILPGNRLSAWTGLTFVGDSDGNRDSTKTGSQTTTYKWGADGRLLSVTQGSDTRTYDYDPLGQLVQRKTNGSVDRYYLWDNGQILAILDGTANTRIAEFVYFGGADQPLARITGPSGSDTVHFYAQDVSGNVIAQFRGTTIEQNLAYDPWGAATSISSHPDTTQLRWKGLLYEDGITSLYYMRARWYDPATRRFVSGDPLGLAAGVNQYAYAGGDPINGTDPTGTCAAEEIAVYVGIIGYHGCLGSAAFGDFIVSYLYVEANVLPTVAVTASGTGPMSPGSGPIFSTGPTGGTPNGNAPSIGGSGPGQTGHDRVPHNPCQQAGIAPNPGWYAGQMLSFERDALTVAGEGSPGTASIFMALGIFEWRRGAQLDAQPLGASRAYANYVFGVGFAAAGFPLSFTLWGANTFAAVSGATYTSAAGPMDASYTALPAANVQNITHGWNAYMNGTTCGR